MPFFRHDVSRFLFQFPNGSIKSYMRVKGLSVICWFQFPNGSIKSPTRYMLPYIVPKSFNSLMVRLKALAPDFRHTLLHHVSIP